MSGHVDHAAQQPSSPKALTLTLAELAGELRTCVRTIRRRLQAGLLPAPIRIGATIRWPRDEIIAWLAAGAPDAEAWAQLRNTAPLRRRGR
jgi:predicted DNA-binding transcriptional regulator AlpA